MSIYDIFILLGGVGLFLYGMTIMSSGLKNACGDNLKVILGKATKNKVTSILAGIVLPSRSSCRAPLPRTLWSSASSHPA